MTVIALVANVMPAAAVCQGASNGYNQALDDISIYLRRYTACLQTSRSGYDCASEFRRLGKAQEDFETAVSLRRKECRE